MSKNKKMGALFSVNALLQWQNVLFSSKKAVENKLKGEILFAKFNTWGGQIIPGVFEPSHLNSKDLKNINFDLQGIIVQAFFSDSFWIEIQTISKGVKTISTINLATANRAKDFLCVLPRANGFYAIDVDENFSLQYMPVAGTPLIEER